MDATHGFDANRDLHILWEDGERVFSRERSRGGDGSVLVARIAAKHPSPLSVARLVREFALKDELDDVWAVRPAELVRADGRTELVLADPGGEPLERLAGAPIEVGAALRFAVGIAVALGKLHQRGLVHKDLKPAHVLVNCADGQVRLTGFGIASRLPRERQRPEPPETIAGTLAYMAPEQTGRMNRSIDSRSDLYAFGVVLYQMLTGTLPFIAADPMEWVHCHVARLPVAPAARVDTVPPAISAVAMKLLEKTPEARYQTAAGVERDLRRCLEQWEQTQRIDAFFLGDSDTPDRLLIPERLYGREREVAALVAAFDRVVRSGAPELVLVSGYSGIGKSAVVNELHKVLVPSRGLFASGKFDQYKRDIPYSTLVQAFQGLVRPLLGKREAELAPWRDALTNALGPNARLMSELIPELKLIIGDPPLVPQLDPHQAQRRFQLVFRRFIGVFAQPEHPLALFLDDLQWLDAATVELLEDLLVGPDLQHVLLIGAYRDNEVDANHPLMHKLRAIRNAGATLDEIALAPLAGQHVERLIDDALRCGSQRATPLAQLVHEKTAGNPFFVIQFLHELVDENLLTFDHDRASWRWNLPHIHGKGYTDNVADLMVAKVARLPVETQRALQQFACLGNTATMAMLSSVSESPPQQIEALLLPAVHHELVEPMDGAYRFAHDRVQEAAYSLIPEASQAETHLRIGRLLAKQTSVEKLRAAIFEIVNQLNRGAALVALQDEREQLAAFNLIAGQRAKASSAYESALSYLAAGAALLTDDCWTRRHDLIFALELNRAECEFLTGRLAAAEQRLVVLSDAALNSVEQGLVTCIRMDVYLTSDRSGHAVAVCLEYLRRIGIEWQSHPGDEDVRREYERIRTLVAGRSIDELLDLPMMADRMSLTTVDVLSKLLRPAWFTDANLAALTLCKVIDLSLERGNCDGSCFAYAMYPRVAGPRFGDYQAGFHFGKLGYELVERRGLTRFEAVTYLCFGMYVVRWTAHIRASSEILQKAFESAVRLGDIPSSAYACCHLGSDRIFAGEPLADLEHAVRQNLAFSARVQFGLALANCTTQLAMIRMLRGTTLKFGCFDDASFDEARSEQHLTGNPAMAAAACWYWVRKLQGRYLAGDYAAAADAASKAKALLWTSAMHLEECEYHFYDALACSELCEQAVAGERERLLEAIAAHHEQLTAWAANCAENFADRAALVGAELARLEGREMDAMQLYEAAMLASRKSGFVHNEALAAELASRFYAARGFEKIARVYLQDARQGYRRWGADGKVRQLDERYPYLREGEAAPLPISTIGAPVEHLDLATVIKVSQAVSGEIVLEQLIDMVMRTAVEQAGAVRGLLILPNGDGPRIAAEVTTDGDTPRVQLRDVPASAEMLPEAVLYHVLRTRESVMLDHAANEPQFAADPYIRQHRTRSLLCLPLMNRAKLIGALYLENNLISGAFAPARIAVLRLLASQAATSLENTRLYRDLAERESRIRRLVDANIIGIFVWRKDGAILDANDAFLRMVGYERDDLVSGRIRWWDLTPPEWRASTELAIAEVNRAGRVQPAEKEYLRKDGSRVPIMIGRVAFDASAKEGVAFVVDLTERKEAEHRLRESYEMLRELTSRRETAREEERKHIAREMHDDLGQYLTALRMRASALRMHVGDGDPKLFDEMRGLVALVDQTMQVVRGVITSLRPPALDSGIVAALEWLADEFNRNGRTVCRLRVQDEDIVMSEDRAIVLFRLVQEALTNVARHAAANEVTITLERTPEAATLEVRDDGLGFDAQAIRRTSFGLAGMEERVLMLGGRIDVASSPGAGTAIRITLPGRGAAPAA